MKWIAIAYALAFVLAGITSANSQQNVITSPYQLGNSNASSTITSGGTFQKVFAANKNRRGCAIQNNGTHDMWVTIGVATASASVNSAMTLSAGNVFHCGDGVVVITGEVAITGTTSDSFYAAQY